jgi:radical SAM protein with 4Fe4S-binding SPASM domain
MKFAGLRRRLSAISGARVRTESWGGIVHLRRPAALVYVNRGLLRALGHPEDPLWASPTPGTAHRAPVELHWTLSRRCDQKCAHCYTNSLPQAPAFDPADAERVADALSAAGVFQVALGGGEPLAEPGILIVARALRARGILPSTTTSGAPVTPDLARRLGDFAQINVSIDAVGPAYAAARGHDRFAMADAAVRRLQAAGVRVGINAVLTRHTFDALPALLDYARERRVSEVELLRLKPTGRGRATYLEDRLEPAQAAALLPTVLEAARRRRLRVKLDCSLAPFVYQHAPDPRVLKFFRIHGCEAGDSLGSLDAEGRLSGCSFLEPVAGDAVSVLTRTWSTDPELARLRGYRDAAPDPCRTCPALALCNGGCRAVSVHLTGDPHRPDPECPRVRTHAEGSARDDR